MNFIKAYLLSHPEWRDFIFSIADSLGYDIDNLTDDQIEEIAQTMSDCLDDEKFDEYVITDRYGEQQYLATPEEIAHEIKFELER